MIHFVLYFSIELKHQPRRTSCRLENCVVHQNHQKNGKLITAPSIACANKNAGIIRSCFPQKGEVYRKGILLKYQEIFQWEIAIFILLNHSKTEFLFLVFFSFPDAQCMAYLPTFGVVLGVNVGTINIPYIEHLGYTVSQFHIYYIRRIYCTCVFYPLQDAGIFIDPLKVEQTHPFCLLGPFCFPFNACHVSLNFDNIDPIGSNSTQHLEIVRRLPCEIPLDWIQNTQDATRPLTQKTWKTIKKPWNILFGYNMTPDANPPNQFSKKTQWFQTVPLLFWLFGMRIPWFCWGDVHQRKNHFRPCGSKGGSMLRDFTIRWWLNVPSLKLT